MLIHGHRWTSWYCAPCSETHGTTQHGAKSTQFELEIILWAHCKFVLVHIWAVISGKSVRDFILNVGDTHHSNVVVLCGERQYCMSLFMSIS